MSIVLDFDKGTIKRDLMEIPDRLLDGAFEALMDVAYLILGIAQVRVRVETGSLRDSGRVERGGKGKDWAVVRVRFGGYVTNPKTGRLVDYAVYVEAKYPYLKPAGNEVQPQLDSIIRRKCLAEVTKLGSVIV